MGRSEQGLASEEKHLSGFSDLGAVFTPKGFDLKAQGKRSAALGRRAAKESLPRRGFINWPTQR